MKKFYFYINILVIFILFIYARICNYISEYEYEKFFVNILKLYLLSQSLNYVL